MMFLRAAAVAAVAAGALAVVHGLVVGMMRTSRASTTPSTSIHAPAAVVMIEDDVLASSGGDSGCGGGIGGGGWAGGWHDAHVARLDHAVDANPRAGSCGDDVGDG